MSTVHAMPFGAQYLGERGVLFRLWAPAAPSVVLVHSGVDGTSEWPLQHSADGWHELTVPGARAGDRYQFRLPDGMLVPDPASRHNPNDVHGPSVVVDPSAYPWQCRAWRGRPWREAVVYELHVGTFTPEGSFDAARGRLPYLAELGITAIELMPLADFPGRRNWGYDGVLLFAPDASYGTPEQLKALVDAAHALGIMVLLDVVYNHFGPDGNYLHAYCPPFFNPARQTPWGAAINFDGANSRTVRDFFIHNALYWIEEYRFDGLRVDAVHAICDDSQPWIVPELCAAVQAGPGRERQVHIVLENDRNQAYLLERGADGRPLVATAQWNDDLHHAAHVMLTGETDGYYADFAQRPAEQFALALAQGFLYTGQPSPFRAGQPHGEPCAHLPPAAFVSYLQTHDQVGNRALGERIDALATPALVQAARACVLLSPHTPMLFMGEEFGCTTPFQFFCDFTGDLAAAVTAGRRAEFGRFAAFADAEARARIPDPNDEETFLQSKLRWTDLDQAQHQQALSHTRQQLTVRREQLMPRWAAGSQLLQWSCENDSMQWTWELHAADGQRSRLHLAAHFGGGDSLFLRPPGREIYRLRMRAESTEPQRLVLPPGGVWASLEEAVR